MENYEQKYKEALEWIRSIYPTMQGAEKEDAEHFFPELKESEDEQHRKWILEYLYDGLRKSDEQFKDQFNAAIAWLEKQGENFPYWKPSEEQLEALDYAFNLYPDTERGNYYEGVLYTLIEDLHRLEKQKEVKMIQWTGDNLKEVTNFTGLSPEFSNWFKSWDDFESYVHSHNDVFKLFFEDGSHYEVPKGAWIVRTPDGYNVASRSKFVEKQVEQKPAWSEEDEELKNSTILYMQGMLEGAVECENTEDIKEFNKIISWLKSLKPRWKPTKEQLKALHWVAEYGNITQSELLKSLYNDLKNF